MPAPFLLCLPLTLFTRAMSCSRSRSSSGMFMNLKASESHSASPPGASHSCEASAVGPRTAARCLAGLRSSSASQSAISARMASYVGSFSGPISLRWARSRSGHISSRESFRCDGWNLSLEAISHRWMSLSHWAMATSMSLAWTASRGYNAVFCRAFTCVGLSESPRSVSCLHASSALSSPHALTISRAVPSVKLSKYSFRKSLYWRISPRFNSQAHHFSSSAITGLPRSP